MHYLFIEARGGSALSNYQCIIPNCTREWAMSLAVIAAGKKVNPRSSAARELLNVARPLAARSTLYRTFFDIIDRIAKSQKGPANIGNLRCIDLN